MKLNPDLHIICGKCGCRTMLTFRLAENAEFPNQPDVFISCGNCGNLTSLDEELERKG